MRLVFVGVMVGDLYVVEQIWTTPLPRLAAELTLLRPVLWGALLLLVMVDLAIRKWTDDRYGTWDQLLLRCVRQAKELREWRRRHPQERWYRSEEESQVQRA